MPDSLESILKRSPLTNTQRADLWDAFNGATNEADLAAKLEASPVPKQVKASLWDLKASFSRSEDFSDVKAGSSDTLAEQQIAQVKPEMGYFDTAGELDRAKEAREKANVGASAKGAALGLSIVAPAMLPARVVGTAMGAQQGYRKGGIPGAVIGAGIGAVKPQAAMLGSGVADAADIADAFTGHRVGPAAGLTAGIAALLLKRYGLGGVGKLLTPIFGSAEAAEAAVVGASKAGTAAEKLAAAKSTTGAADAVLAESGWSAEAIAAHAKEAKAAASAGGEAVSANLPGVVSTPGQLSQEQLKMVFQLQAMAKQGGQSKQAVANAAREMFPNNPEVIEMITGPITRMPSISMPR